APSAWQWSSLIAPLYAPAELLFFPALWIMVADVYSWPFTQGLAFSLLTIIAVALLLVAYLVIALAEHNPGLARLMWALRRVFFRGGMLAVSVVVIVLAGAWLLDFSYVKTVMEGDRFVIVWYVAASYTLLWTFEYWLN